MQRRLVPLAAAVLWLSGSGVASAQMTGNVERLKADLHGENLDAAVAAASALGSLKDDALARDALMGGLQLGAPPKLLGALLEALGLHKSPKAVDLLRHYVRYRSPEIRETAIRALGAIEDPRVPLTLIEALGDSHPMPRARAARILGERKERRAERPLLKMLRRGDGAAAGPLGQVGGVETAKQLAELIGDVPDRPLAVALGEMLKRKDFGPDPLRTEVVKALGRIPGPDAATALSEYVASVPEKETRLSKQQAEKLLEQRKK
ncbi:MAG: HEAT repeat domain-containing protein [Deltaproteobacteria bacterium]|nr:HEAT repeat domain-containing protein [Deltaproteobacteria bacterium]